MWFVGLGVLLVVLKLAGVALLSQLSWYWVCAPFGVAVVWWAAADSMGLTQRRAMADEAERAQRLRERRYESLGMRVPRHHSSPPRPPQG